MPTPAGYSGTPLVKKLGFKPGMRVRFIDEPAHYLKLVGPLPENITIVKSARGPLDFIHLFVTKQTVIERKLPIAKKLLKPDGTLWISWPKKTSSLETDLVESIIRETGLAASLVDVKICAVDNDWSGLKFVYRLKDRPKKP